MTDNLHQQPPPDGEARHPLDGVRLRLPVPKGRHHADIVASLARWLGQRYGLEPFDLELFDAPGIPGGMLSMHELTPGRRLDLSVKRSHDAMRRADVVGTSSARLRTEATSIRSQARLLASEGRRRREAAMELRTTTDALRRQRTERSEAPNTSAITRFP